MYTVTVSGRNVAQGSTFQQYAHADIRGGSVVGEFQATVGWSEPAIFSNFRRHSEPLRFKAILLCSVTKCLVGFPVTLKCLTLNDLEMPRHFMLKSVFFCRRFYFSASLYETTV